MTHQPGTKSSCTRRSPRASPAVADTINEMLERPSTDFDAVTLALLIKGEDGIANNTWDSRTGPEEAVRRSPRSAVAHANYGAGLLVASGYVSPDKAGDFRSRAIAEIARARELDPQEPQSLMWEVQLIEGRQWSERLSAASRPPHQRKRLWQVGTWHPADKCRPRR